MVIKQQWDSQEYLLPKKKFYHSFVGFTIVELLIVVVVIAILAAIVIVSYNGVTTRANDTAVQSNIRDISTQFQAYYVDKGVYPVSNIDLGSIGVKVAKNSYGTHMINGGHEYNLLYCRPQTDPAKYAIIGSSKSGTLYQLVDGNMTTISRTAWDTVNVSSTTLCSNAGIPTSVAQVWLYQSDVWASWIVN